MVMAVGSQQHDSGGMTGSSAPWYNTWWCEVAEQV